MPQTYLQTDLKEKVKMLDGKPAKVPNDEGTELVEYTVAEAFRRALNGVFPSENNPHEGKSLPFTKKMERYKLSEKIFNNESPKLNLTTDEQTTLKHCVELAFHQPEVCGYLSKIIEKKHK